MQSDIHYAVHEAVKAAKYLTKQSSLTYIENAAKALATCFSAGGKLLIAGNGGSLCDAMHFAEELTGQFRKKRAPLAAIALGDPSHMSCTANDMGFEEVFSRLVEAYGKKGDILVVLTTSGQSVNLIRAHAKAKDKGLFTIAFLGKTGGPMLGSSDLEWLVEGFPTSDRIQEAHMAAIHIIIEMVEKYMGYAPKNQQVAEAFS